MTYTEILIKLTNIRTELSNLGCEPVAESIDLSIKELIYAYDNDLIK